VGNGLQVAMAVL